MADSASLQDLLGLLGLGDTMAGVLAGSVRFTEAQAAFSRCAGSWPAVPVDWIAVLDAAGEQLEALRETAEQQVQVVERCNDALGAAAGEGNPFGVVLLETPADRLLTAAELQAVKEVPLRIWEVGQEWEGRAEEEEEVADELEGEAEELQNQLDEMDDGGEDGDGG